MDRPTPFSSILESQPPWWRLGGGGVCAVMAYLGLLVAALSLGGKSGVGAVARPEAPRVVVELVERAPVVAASDPEVREVRAAGPKVRKPREVRRAEAVAEEVKPVGSEASGGPTPSVPVTSTPASTSTSTPTSSVAVSGRDEVLPFMDGMTRPKLIEVVEPVYTREAREAKVQGLFLAKCVITTSGSLQKCRVVKGLPLMDQAVLNALSRWRYTPVIYQGRPVAVDYVVQVRLAGPR